MKMSGEFYAPATVSPGIKLRYSLHRRLGGPQSRNGRSGEEKNFHSCRESNPGRPERSLVTILAELSRLPSTMVHYQAVHLIHVVRIHSTRQESYSFHGSA
jgi:hypothetical protein